MKVSLITVAYNAGAHIESCIRSVLGQDYAPIEYIVIDGASTDDTLSIVQGFGDRISVLLSEPDKGIYDAMNKGLARATGDMVGILNADDFYPHAGVISRVVREFQETGADTVFGDLVYVKEENPQEIVRFFPGRGFHPAQMRRGLMPPHPTFFVRRSLYEQCGNFDDSYAICADFELMVRLFHTYGASYSYIPETLTHMRAGGVSTRGMRSTLTINREMLRACNTHGVSTNLLRIYSKYLTKIFQLVRKPV